MNKDYFMEKEGKKKKKKAIVSIQKRNLQGNTELVFLVGYKSLCHHSWSDK